MLVQGDLGRAWRAIRLAEFARKIPVPAPGMRNILEGLSGAGKGWEI
ncbi:MAG: hypothetical protein ACPL5F_02650 [Moorellaceae bacterium]